MSTRYFYSSVCMPSYCNDCQTKNSKTENLDINSLINVSNCTKVCNIHICTFTQNSTKPFRSVNLNRGKTLLNHLEHSYRHHHCCRHRRRHLFCSHHPCSSFSVILYLPSAQLSWHLPRSGYCLDYSEETLHSLADDASLCWLSLLTEVGRNTGGKKNSPLGIA